MRKIKLFISIVFAATSICSAQNSYYGSQSTPPVAQTDIATKWEKISFAGSDLSYMFSTEGNQTLFNLKWGATNFVLDRTKPLSMLTSDGRTYSLRLTSYEAFSKEQGSGSNIRKIAEGTSVSYSGDFGFLAANAQVNTLRFYAEDGSLISIDLSSKNAQKLNAAYTSSLPVRQNNNMATAPAEQTYASVQPSCNVCPYSSPAYTSPSVQSETVPCDIHSSNFGDGCLSGKQQTRTGVPANYGEYASSAPSFAQQGGDVVNCDIKNPNFADACLNGKRQAEEATRQLAGEVYYHPENAMPYQKAKQGTYSHRIPATELYPNGVSSSNKQTYSSAAATSKAYARNTASNLNPDIDWKNYISVQSAFGSDVQETVPSGYNPRNTSHKAIPYSNNSQSVVKQPVAEHAQPETVTYYPHSNTISATSDATPADAPASITVEGFWGLQFGAQQNATMDYLLATKRIDRINVIASSGEATLLENVNMANVVYDNATLMFKEGLSSGLFTKSYETFQAANNDVEIIKNSLTQKYGQPDSSIDPSSSRYYWHDNANMRTIMLEQKLYSNNEYGVDLFYVDRNLSGQLGKTKAAPQKRLSATSVVAGSDY